MHIRAFIGTLFLLVYDAGRGFCTRAAHLIRDATLYAPSADTSLHLDSIAHAADYVDVPRNKPLAAFMTRVRQHLLWHGPDAGFAAG